MSEEGRQFRKMLTAKEVCELVQLTDWTVRRHVSQGKFPKPLPLGSWKRFWLLEDIVRWQEEKIAEARGLPEEPPPEGRPRPRPFYPRKKR